MFVINYTPSGLHLPFSVVLLNQMGNTSFFFWEELVDITWTTGFFFPKSYRKKHWKATALTP